MSAVSNRVMPRSIALWITLREVFQIGALAEIVAAEADGGNAQAGAAEIANLHGSILWEDAGRAGIVARATSPGKQRGYAAGTLGSHAAQKDAAPVRRGD